MRITHTRACNAGVEPCHCARLAYGRVSNDLRLARKAAKHGRTVAQIDAAVIRIHQLIPIRDELRAELEGTR